MKLNILERIIVLGILPQEGNFVTLKIINDLKNSLSFTENEIKEFEINFDDNKYTWNSGGNVDKEISMGEKAIEVIKNSLVKLNSEERLTMNHYSLYEKFVEEK